jgi:FKBP-type peptidyl-prolyl cis-trans isomerase FkpA
MKIKALLFSCFVGATVLCTSCGGDEINEDTREELGQYISDNNIDAVLDESGLYYVIHEAGSDTMPTEFSSVLVNYEGRTIADDEIFDEGDTTAILLSSTIQGWQVGIPKIGIGGSMTLYIPSDMGYGKDGTGPIAGDANLVFDVDLIDVDGLRSTAVREAAEEVDIAAYIAERDLDPFVTDEGVYIHINEEGETDRPDVESTVTIHYYGERLDGQQIDSSYDRNRPSTFALSSVIEGWQIAIPYFGKGGSGTIIIPSRLAYGAQDRPGIPPHTPLAFDIELIDF